LSGLWDFLIVENRVYFIREKEKIHFIVELWCSRIFSPFEFCCWIVDFWIWLKNVLPKKSSKTPSIIDYLAIINPACLKLAGLWALSPIHTM
jgi:hypothetical protein